MKKTKEKQYLYVKDYGYMQCPCSYLLMTTDELSIHYQAGHFKEIWVNNKKPKTIEEIIGYYANLVAQARIK